MPNNLEFILKLQDLLTPGMRGAATAADTAAGKISNDMTKVAHSADSANGGIKKLAGGLVTLGGILGGLGFLGITAGIAEMARKGLEKVHELHEAEIALGNTMKNMGTYSDESFDKVVKGSVELSKGILFSRSQVVDLQSQLRLVGNIGEGEMARLVTASADLATKFHMGLGEGGSLLAKAVNNPEILRMLARKIYIDPAVVIHLQDLAKNGHEAQARLELLSIVEQKVGGAAAAAFNADPMGRYNKSIEDLELTLGDLANKIRVLVLPYAIRFLEWVKNAVEWVQKNSAEIKIWVEGLGAAWLAFKTATMFIIPFVEGLASIGPAGAVAAEGMEAAGAAATVSLGPIGLLVLAIGAITAAWISASAAEANYKKISEDNLKSVYQKETEGITADIKSLQDKYHLTNKEAFSRITESESNLLATQMGENAMALQKATRMYEDAKGRNVHGDLSKSQDHIQNLQNIQNNLMTQKAALDAVKAAGPGSLPKQKKKEDLKIDTGSEKANSINSGGQRSIVINIAKQIEKLEVHVMDAKEGVNEIENMVREAMRRVVYSMNGRAS